MLRSRLAPPAAPCMRRLLPVAFLLVTVGAAAQDSRPAGDARPGVAAMRPDTSDITPALIDKGRKLYRGKGGCGTCHGMKLEGTTIAPAHRKSTGWKNAAEGAFPELVRVIASGVPGTVMAAYPNGISADDGVALAAYIWAVNHRDVKP